MTLGTGELTNRFLDEIKLRALDDRYLDRREEREILQYAIGAGVNLEVARVALLEACRQKGFLAESSVVEEVKSRLDAEHQRNGKLGREVVEGLLTWLQEKLHGMRGKQYCQSLVIEQIERQHYRVRSGWLSNWYAALKHEAGLR